MNSGVDSRVGGEMDSDRRLERVVEIERAIAVLQAEQARHVAAIADDPCRDAPAPVVEKEYFREELRVRLGESAGVIAGRIEIARMLVHQLPAALGALEAGGLTMRHVRALCDGLAGLPEAQIRTVEAECVAFAAGRDYTAFARKVRREVVRATTPSCEEQLAAALAERRVWSYANRDGATATVGAVLPADDAQVVLAAVDLAAEQAADQAAMQAADGAGTPEKETEPRTREQRRADALVQIARDWLAGIAATGRRVGPAVQVCVAASTLLGVDDQPGELAGHGPVPAALARAIAADPSGTWRRLITDERGRLVDYGRRTYRPPTALREFVIARDRECQFPGCHRQARFCEIDHLQPWAEGGSTDADNLISLCTRHHHLKHDTDWTVRRLSDGRLHWTSPDGHTAHNDPATYPTDSTGDEPAAEDQRPAA